MSKARVMQAGVWYQPADGALEQKVVGQEPKVLAVTPEIQVAALRAYRAAKAQFMLSDDEATRMVVEAVLQAAS